MSGLLCADLRTWWCLGTWFLVVHIRSPRHMAIATFSFDLNLPADHIEQLPHYPAQAESSRNPAAVPDLPSKKDSREGTSEPKNQQQPVVLNIAKNDYRHRDQPSSEEKTGFCESIKESGTILENSKVKDSILDTSKRKRGKDETEHENENHIVETKSTITQFSPNFWKDTRKPASIGSREQLNPGNWDFMRLEPLRNTGNSDVLLKFFKTFSEINIYNQGEIFSIKSISLTRFHSIYAKIRSDDSSDQLQGWKPEFLRIIFLKLYYKSFDPEDIEKLLQSDLKELDHTQEYLASACKHKAEEAEKMYKNFITRFSELSLDISRISLVVIKALYTLIADYQIDKTFLDEKTDLLQIMKETWKDIFNGEEEVIKSNQWAKEMWEASQVHQDLKNWRKVTIFAAKKSQCVGFAWKLAAMILLRKEMKLTRELCSSKMVIFENGNKLRRYSIHLGIVKFINKIVFLSNKESISTKSLE